MPVFDYAGQNNDKVWLKYSYEYRVYWSHIPQVSLVRGPHHHASTQKIDLTDVVNGTQLYIYNSIILSTTILTTKKPSDCETLSLSYA